jgi:hypothetical protein
MNQPVIEPQIKSDLFSNPRTRGSSQLVLRLTLVCVEMGLWHGLFWSERFAGEVRVLPYARA